jgi:hypothetical protein
MSKSSTTRQGMRRFAEMLRDVRNFVTRGNSPNARLLITYSLLPPQLTFPMILETRR